jgi:uncharacterized glyoxalase superfamily protein PhnB
LKAGLGAGAPLRAHARSAGRAGIPLGEGPPLSRHRHIHSPPSVISGITLGVRDLARAKQFSEGLGFRGFTLSYVVPSAERVGEVLAQAQRAGGKVARAAQQAQWGGYFGCFTGPDGCLWKAVASA